jgi:serine/threonine protein kinase
MSSPPTTLGQYQIIREIARSNDIVYEAYDPLMNRRVAVKELMMPHGSTGPQQEDRISRFKREAQAAGTLNHPNIMTVYSFAEDSGRTFMAMEYLDGQTLRNEIDVKGTVTTNRAIQIAEDVLSGLEHAHSKGVIHRDIKPDNIQILSNDSVKITDFGIARLTFQPNLTIDGQVFGTPSYMSPEQVVGRDIDARSDLFSVGVMLYEMLTGKKPFGGDSVVSITYAIMNAEPERPQTMQWPLWSVIERALSKSPAMRYANALEMKHALQEALSPSAGVLPVSDGGQGGYSLNPYASNPAPPPQIPTGNPFASPNQPNQAIQAPYNPYSAPSSSANPYAGQYAQPSQPATYPYNPFASGAGGGVPPHTPGMASPMYYPPLPRQPLFKPETAMFIKKLALALLIVGTLAAVLVIGTQAVVSLMAQAGPIQQRTINAQQDAERAVEAQKEGKPADSEYYDGKAIDNDPQNPEYNSHLAKLYWSSATNSQDPKEQAELFLQSAAQFKLSADHETNSATKQDDENNYAYAAINAASASMQVGDSDLTRQSRISLENAKAYVTNDPDITAKINDILPRLSA